MSNNDFRDYNLRDLISIAIHPIFAARCRAVEGTYYSAYTNRIKIGTKRERVYTGWLCLGDGAEQYHIWSNTDFSSFCGKHVIATVDERNGWHEKAGGKIVFYSYAQRMAEAGQTQKRA